MGILILLSYNSNKIINLSYIWEPLGTTNSTVIWQLKHVNKFLGSMVLVINKLHPKTDLWCLTASNAPKDRINKMA